MECGRTGTRAGVRRKFMSHKYLMPFLAAAFLVAPAVLPRALVSAIAPRVSGTAQAAINLNSSRSNIYRTAKSRGSVTTPKASEGGDRMGGGGGRGGGARMGGGGGSRTMGAERMGGGGGGRTK